MKPKNPVKRLTPTKTVYEWCRHCIQDRRSSEVEDCGGGFVYATGKPCPFYSYRMGKRVPVKVFRQFCLECMGGRAVFVSECETEDCPIYPYRMGKNPALKGRRFKPEHMAAMRARKGKLTRENEP